MQIGRPALPDYLPLVRRRRLLLPGLSKNCFFQIRDARDELVLLRRAEISFDRVHLSVEGYDLILGRHLLAEIGDILRHRGETFLHHARECVDLLLK
jgi:hypothetical protein